MIVGCSISVMNDLWRIADEFEDRARDRDGQSPLARLAWKQAHQELVAVLGERV